VIRFEGISKIYSKDVVLKNINWEIKKGEKIGLVGSNGAGKSTQFKILIGEEDQTSGTIIKEGNPKIAHLKQELDCNLNYSVREELESSFKDIKIVALKLLEIENENDLSGLLIFASEGINGTICAEKYVIDIVINLLNKYTINRNLNIKVNFSKKKVFKKLKIKIKNEIVTMGINEINPSEDNGTYIDSADWNKLIKNQNTIVIDTRNHYEVSIGTFQNSINPNTRNFSEFPRWVDDHLDSHLENKELKENFSNFFKISLLKQTSKGKKNAVVEGFNISSGETLAIIDSDFTVDIDDSIAAIMESTKNKNILINCARTTFPMEKDAMRWANYIGNRLFAIFLSILINKPISDSLCGTKVFSRKFFKLMKQNGSWDSKSDPFGDFTIIFEAAKNNIKILNYPVRYYARKSGAPNISRWIDGLKLLKVCWIYMIADI